MSATFEGWLAKPTGPAKFLDGQARVSLFEEANDLLIGKSGLFQSRYSPKLANFVPSLWYGREGAGHLIGKRAIQVSHITGEETLDGLVKLALASH